MAVKKQPDIHVCDRCGYETTDKGDTRDQECGSTTLKYSGSTGGMCIGGDWGGSSHSSEAWLCLDCTKAFLTFIRGGA